MQKTFNEQEHIYSLIGLLHHAGIKGIVEPIENQYWPNDPSYDSVRTPWICVVTGLGTIIIGWRKRVISISWSESTIKTHGRDVVKNLEITHGEHMCHAYGYHEAAGCLQRLWESCASPDLAATLRSADPDRMFMLHGLDGKWSAYYEDDLDSLATAGDPADAVISALHKTKTTDEG